MIQMMCFYYIYQQQCGPFSLVQKDWPHFIFKTFPQRTRKKCFLCIFFFPLKYLGLLSSHIIYRLPKIEFTHKRSWWSKVAARNFLCFRQGVELFSVLWLSWTINLNQLSFKPCNVLPKNTKWKVNWPQRWLNRRKFSLWLKSPTKGSNSLSWASTL